MFSLATMEYGWFQAAERDGRAWEVDEPQAMIDARSAGLTHWEPFLRAPGDLTRKAMLAHAAGLKIRSAYVGGPMHESSAGQRTQDLIAAISEEAACCDLFFLVVNPEPLSWSEKLDKTDAELRIQAGHLQAAGELLQRKRLRLCYHSHDAEMRMAAREFHHMLNATTPQAVGLCLDPHWIWRGAGNSQVALMDVVALYHSRIESIHLRQSQNGVWAEVVGEGDLDYGALADALASRNLRPQLVIEHALEEGTPHSMTQRQANEISGSYIRRRFSASKD